MPVSSPVVELTRRYAGATHLFATVTVRDHLEGVLTLIAQTCARLQPDPEPEP